MQLFRTLRASRAAVTLPVDHETAYDLCKRALHEVLGCMTTDADPRSNKLTAVCQYKTVASGTRVVFVFAFGTSSDGTTISVTAPAPWPGTLSRKLKDYRDEAVADLASHLQALAAADAPAR